jgi:hypothetical protein
MKLSADRRLYHCYACDALMLIPPDEVMERLARRKPGRRTASTVFA